MNKEINKNTMLILQGLVLLGKQYSGKIGALVDAATEIISADVSMMAKEQSDFRDELFDVIYGDRETADALGRIGIKAKD